MPSSYGLSGLCSFCMRVQVEWALIFACLLTYRSSIRMWQLTFETVKINLLWYKTKFKSISGMSCWKGAQVGSSLVLTVMAQRSTVVPLGVILMIFSQDLLRYAYGWVHEHIRNNHSSPITLQSFTPITPETLGIWPHNPICTTYASLNTAVEHHPLSISPRFLYVQKDRKSVV